MMTLMILVMVSGVMADVSNIEVTSPDGGEYLGGSYDVTWDADCGDEGAVRIYEGSGGTVGNPSKQSFVKEVLCSLKSYSWDVSDLAGGNNYQVKIISAFDSGVYDYSGGFFTVDNLEPVVEIDEVISPTNQDTQIITGSFTEINFDKVEVNGIIADIVDDTFSAEIDLVDGSNLVNVVVTDLAGNTGGASVEIEVDLVDPIVTISPMPVDEWVVGEGGVTVSVECSDVNGCNEASYAVKEVSKGADCSAEDYAGMTGEITVDSYAYVCAKAEDNAGNEGFLFGAIEFRVHDTIQEAIKDASEGDTILVSDGVYDEDLVIDKGLTLREANEVVIDGAHVISASGVILDGFSFEAGGRTAIIIDSSNEINSVQILNSVFELGTSSAVGVVVGTSQKVSNVVISDNVFNGPDNKECNPWKIGGWFGNTVGVEVENVDFERNEVNSCSIPINLHDKNIRDILISDNVFRDTDGVVYVWGEGIPTGVLSDFVFTNNDVDSSNSYGVGIDVFGVFDDDNFGEGNRVNKNKFVGIPGAYRFEAVSILSDLGSYELDATNNFWGCSKGPEDDDCSSISEGVVYGPWTYDEDMNVDMTKPETEVVSPEESSWQKQDFEVSITDGDALGEAPDTGVSGLDVCKYRVRSGDSWSATKSLGTRDCSVPVVLSVGVNAYCESEGEDVCKIQAFAEDNAGNKGDVVERVFSVDFTAPETTDDSENYSDWYDLVTIALTCDDEISGCGTTYYCVDQTTDPCEPTIEGNSVVIDSEGTNYISYYSVDVAGNAEKVKTSSAVKIDTLAPEITEVTGDVVLEVNGTETICALVTDAGSGVESVVLSYDSTQVTMEVVDDAYCADIPSQEESGSLTYVITAIDGTGQEATSSDYVIEVFDFVIELSSGWNLFSLPVVPESTAIEDVLGDADVSKVYAYDVLDEDADDGWLIADGVTGSLDTMTSGFGYWAYAESDSVIKGNGKSTDEGPITPPSRNLARNWNLIGLFGKQSKEVEKALWSLELERYKVFDVDDVEVEGDLFPENGYWLAITHTPGSVEEDYYTYYP